MIFVLLHSPMLGPGSWEPVAQQLRARRHMALVPDLRLALSASTIWQAQVEAVVRRLPDTPDRTLWFAAHSGAGPLLPAIRDRVPETPAGYLLVDAAMPHPGKSRLQALPQELAVSLRALAEDGLLPPWHEWFGSEALERLLPDPVMREDFIAEEPRVPMRMFEEALPEGRGWPNAPACYLRLSGAYLEESAKAVGMGFRAAVLDSDHLAILTRPAEVADAMLRLVGPPH